MARFLLAARYNDLSLEDRTKFLCEPMRYPWLRAQWSRLTAAEQRELRKVARAEPEIAWDRFNRRRIRRLERLRRDRGNVVQLRP